MTVSIGAIFGGPEMLPCRSALQAVWDHFKGNEDKPFLNVVFHFPGTLINPTYTGLRTGRFSSKEQGYMIQVAVPEPVAQSADLHMAVSFFLDSIEEALALSKSRWEKHKIDFPIEGDLAHVQRVRRILQQ